MSLPPDRRCHRLVLGLWIAGAIAAAGCDDENIRALHGRIEVDPAEIDFGEGCLDAENVLRVAIKNRGSAILDIEGTSIAPDDGVFRVEALPEAIAVAGTLSFTVVFVPTTERAVYSATLTIRSDDATTPALAVPLRGVGGFREADVAPLSIDFGLVNEGTAPRRSVTITNLGGQVLDISAVTWTSTSVDLQLAPDTFIGGPLACRTATTVDLIYAPTDIGGDHGVLTVVTDDADEPQFDVDVVGRANLAPLAVAWICDIVAGQVGCPADDRRKRHTATVMQSRGLEGGDSFDPEGGVIADYRWVVADPPASRDVTIFHSTADRLNRQATGDVQVMAPGKYTVRLVVKDDKGLSSFATPQSEVRLSPKDLEVLLKWNIRTDVDLHMVQPGGRIGDYGGGNTGTSTGTDCSTFNRTPDWGLLGDDSDDPALDIDVVNARGPEIISMNDPEVSDVYRVFAHYCDSRNRQVAVDVTFEIYVEGQVIQTIPETGRTFSLAPGELWEAATIRWVSDSPPMAEVTALSTTPTAMPGLCMLR